MNTHQKGECFEGYSVFLASNFQKIKCDFSLNKCFNIAVICVN